MCYPFHSYEVPVLKVYSGHSCQMLQCPCYHVLCVIKCSTQLYHWDPLSHQYCGCNNEAVVSHTFELLAIACFRNPNMSMQMPCCFMSNSCKNMLAEPARCNHYNRAGRPGFLPGTFPLHFPAQLRGFPASTFLTCCEGTVCLCTVSNHINSILHVPHLGNTSYIFLTEAEDKLHGLQITPLPIIIQLIIHKEHAMHREQNSVHTVLFTCQPLDYWPNASFPH